jgi:hypothetical protein
MTDSPANQEPPDVPTQVFEKFLEAVRDAKLSDELVSRLHKVLLEDHSVNEGALRVAVLGEERLP